MFNLNPNANIFIPLTFENLNILCKETNCKAKNVTGHKYGEQCNNIKIDNCDYCFLHKNMIDSGKYFILKNKRQSKYNSDSDSTESEDYSTESEDYSTESEDYSEDDSEDYSTESEDYYSESEDYYSESISTLSG